MGCHYSTLREIVEFIYLIGHTKCDRSCEPDSIHRKAQYFINDLLRSGELVKLERFILDREKEESNGVPPQQ